MSSVTHTIGRRKRATARIFLSKGEGTITVNGRPLDEYFGRASYSMHVKEPLAITEQLSGFNVKVTVRGGGLTGQAGAARMGIARALVALIPELRPALKKAGMLTRDPREVERKKPGRPGARKRFQFSKR